MTQALTVMHSYNAQELIHKIFCGSDNMQSNLREQLDAAVKCKRGELALVFATQCARDTDIGAYCSEVQFYSGDFVELYTTCEPEAAAGTCSEEYSFRLRTLCNALGCCINAVINTT